MDFEGVNVTADSQQLQVDSLQNPLNTSMVYLATFTIKHIKHQPFM